MKLHIDNFDGRGLVDYTSAVDGSESPRVLRKLNRPGELRFRLASNGETFIVPVAGARIVFAVNNGHSLFTGYLRQAPGFEYLGWGELGPVYRYDLVADSDEALLDEKRLPERCPFVERSAGSALRQLTEDAIAGGFDTSAVQSVDTIAWYRPDPRKVWSEQAAEIAKQVRASFRCLDGALIFSPVGTAVYPLNETDIYFSPQGLRLQAMNLVTNDVTVVGEMEPQAFVTDYFVGDNFSRTFFLSQIPFSKFNGTHFDEEYTTSSLESTLWSATDPTGSISVSSGKLQIAGGAGDGVTTVLFVEPIELGGATVLQHGDVMFTAASTGVIGGLYPGAISVAGCLAGFQITPSGTQSNIQALVNGAAIGTAITTVAGSHYVLTTRLYSLEVYRRRQIFHSSLHPASAGRGGDIIAADVRIVMEIHAIDPADPATQVAPSTVLYDGVISGAPAFCKYAQVNAANLHCAISFSRLIQPVDAEVRSALPGESYVTRLVGPLSTGAECNVSSSQLAFFSNYVPATNQLIIVRYRGRGRALARITNPASATTEQKGVDDGVRGAVLHVARPLARTSVDCETAALALLDDEVLQAWSGEYQTWSDFLPGDAVDIFPGDALHVNVPSRGADFRAIVREVEISAKDLAGDHCFYQIKFANDAAATLSFEFQPAQIGSSLDVVELTDAQAGGIFPPDLTSAAVTAVTSTTVSLDAGTTLPPGGGIEVRSGDQGWSMDNDRNLVGRFSTQTFVVPRLTRVPTYFLRQYDASTPPKYSRYSAALHIDRPF